MLSFTQFLLSESKINPLFNNDELAKEIDELVADSNHRELYGMSSDAKKRFVAWKIKTFMEKHEKNIQKVKRKFERVVSKEIRKFTKNAKVQFKVDEKDLKPIIDKVYNRGRSIASLGDIVRGAILFETKKEADDFVAGLIRKNKQMVVDYEEKKRGEDRTYGYYGSHHLDLNIDGLYVELQVMTRKLWSYKEAAHDIYKANRSSGSDPDNFDTHMSKKIFDLGNRANESILEGMESLSFTEEELWEMQFDGWSDVNIEESLD